MLNFQSAKDDLSIDVGEAGSPVELMFRFYGHYRLDHFDQTALEDLRQRMSRQGVSLNSFRTTCLPVIRSMLRCAVKNDMIKGIPVLFHYDIMPTLFECEADNWIEWLYSQIAPATVRRYQKILHTHVLPKLGQVDICVLDGNHMQQYRQEFFASGGSKSSFLFHERIIYGIIDYVVAKNIQENKAVVRYLIKKESKPRPVTLQAVAQEWLDAEEEEIRSDEADIVRKYLIPLLGQTDLNSDYTRRLIVYRRELARLGKGERVFQSHIAVINKLRRYAVLRGWMEKAPSLKEPKRRDIVGRLPTEREREILLQYWSEEPDSLILCLAAQMGLRNDEIRMLRWTDIDFEHKIATVGERQVPIPDSLILTLKTVGNENGAEGYIVLTAKKKIGPVSMAYLIVAAQRLFKRYGVEHIRLDDLRNDYIIRRLRTDTPEIVAEQCGFSNVSVLMEKYIDFFKNLNE